jgi:hypothetical protein
LRKVIVTVWSSQLSQITDPLLIPAEAVPAASGPICPETSGSERTVKNASDKASDGGLSSIHFEALRNHKSEFARANPNELILHAQSFDYDFPGV